MSTTSTEDLQEFPTEKEMDPRDNKARPLSMSTTSMEEARSFKLRPPEFDGSFDVEIYISQFEDIATLSQWPETIRPIKLREGLKGAAVECGRARSLPEIYEKLRERFGVTP